MPPVDDDFSVTVTTRCIWQYASRYTKPVMYITARSTLKLVERSTLNTLTLQLKAADVGKKKLGAKDLFLLPRFNKPRPVGTPPLSDQPLAGDKTLATLSMCDGDHIDDTPNPEVAAALTAIGNELEFASGRYAQQDLGRTCPRCGERASEDTKPGLAPWWYCSDPRCEYPSLKLPSHQGFNQPHIQAFELRQYVVNRAHAETAEPLLKADAVSNVAAHVAGHKAMPSLPQHKLRTDADADALYNQAKPYLEAVMTRRGERTIVPGILHLLGRYLREIAEICDDDDEADPIAAFLRRHDPTTYMEFAASQQPPASADDGERGKHARDGSIKQKMQRDLEQTLSAQRLDAFQPRQCQQFKFVSRRVLKLRGKDAVRDGAEVEVQLKQPLEVRVSRQAGQVRRAVGQTLMGWVQVDLKREVSINEGDEIKKNAAVVQRVGASAGFDSGAVVWISVEQLKPNLLLVPGAHNLRAGAGPCCVLTALKRSRLAGSRAVTEEHLKSLLQPHCESGEALPFQAVLLDPHTASRLARSLTRSLTRAQICTPTSTDTTSASRN